MCQFQAEQGVIQGAAAVLEEVDNRFAVNKLVWITNAMRVDAMPFKCRHRIGTVAANKAGKASEICGSHLPVARH
jgi:hypothetical protein